MSGFKYNKMTGQTVKKKSFPQFALGFLWRFIDQLLAPANIVMKLQIPLETVNVLTRLTTISLTGRTLLDEFHNDDDYYENNIIFNNIFLCRPEL